MKGMKNVEISSPVPAPTPKAGGGVKSGNINIPSGAKAQGVKSSSQPSTAGGKIVSPTKSK